jgi:preprotein translocase subunit SecF
VLGSVVDQVRGLIDQTVPTELAFVDLTKFDESTRRALEKAHAERLAENAALTIRFYGKTPPPEHDGLAPALAEAMAAPFRAAAQDRGKILARMTEYLRSEECDLQLDSPAAIPTIAAALAELGQFDDASIREALRRTVPAKTQADDPQGIDYATATVKLRLKDIGDEQRLTAARAAVSKAIGVDLADPANRALAADLDADLAGVSSLYVSLPAKQFKRIAKRAPPEKELVKLAATLTGWPPLSVMLDRELISTMIASILLAVTVIVALLALQLRSIVGGLLAATPICFTILLTFGVMSLLRVPLDNSTMMIASIAMGIGVGYTIQFVARLKWELREGRPPEAALAATVGTTGRAILINSLAVGAGFLALVFSSMTPQKRFGSLIALTMLVAAVAALTILPAIFGKWRPASLRAADERKP